MATPPTRSERYRTVWQAAYTGSWLFNSRDDGNAARARLAFATGAILDEASATVKTRRSKGSY